MMFNLILGRHENDPNHNNRSKDKAKWRDLSINVQVSKFEFDT